MSDPRSRNLPRQSVLDRLIDPDPVPTVADDAQRRILEDIRRNLEWLLNTRRPATEPPTALTQVWQSVYMFGLPDISQMSIRSKTHRSQLQSLLQSAISSMEPRLQNVRISLADASEQARVLRFIVDATLHVPPCIERVAFNTTVHLGTGECKVSEQS